MLGEFELVLRPRGVAVDVEAIRDVVPNQEHNTDLEGVTRFSGGISVSWFLSVQSERSLAPMR